MAVTGTEPSMIDDRRRLGDTPGNYSAAKSFGGRLCGAFDGREGA